MSRTDDILDKTKRKDSEAKKWKVVAGIVVGLVLAGGLFCGLYYTTLPITTSHFSTHFELIKLYDFYDKKIGDEEAAVYFVGSSHMATSIYTPFMDEELNNRGYDFVTYSVFNPSNTPIMLAMQTERIIESKPSLIIYGVSLASLTWGLTNEEQTLIAVSQGRFDKTLELLSLYPETYQYLFDENPFYARGYLVRSFMPHSMSDFTNTHEYIKESYGIERRLELDKGKSLENILAEIPDGGVHLIENPTVENQLNALNYTLQKFMDANIPTVLISMPQHPLLSDAISEDDRLYVHNRYDGIGVKWFDFEKKYGDEHFVDTAHASWSGCQEFSHDMVNLVIQELS